MAELTIRLVFSLAIVLGLLLLCARLAGRRFQGHRDAMVQVVHRQAIGRHASVSVVNVNGRILVLGTTEQAVRLLTELDPEALAEEHDEQDGPAVDGSERDDRDDRDDLGTTERDDSADVHVQGAVDPVLTLLRGGHTAELEAHHPEQPAGRHSYTGRHAIRPPGRHADRTVAVDAEVLPSAPVLPTLPAPVLPAVAAPVLPTVPAPIPAVPTFAGRPASTESIAKALSALEALDVLQGRSVRPAAIEVPAAMLLAEEPVASAADVLAAELDTIAEVAPRRATSRRATARRAARAQRPAQRPADHDGALAGSLLSTRTWRQAWGAVSGHAS